MFARIVTFPLKPESTAKLTDTVEKSVVPLLRAHKGFLDQFMLVTSDGKTGYGISFWDNKENADAYNRSGYRDVLKVLDPVIAGPTQLQLCKVTNSTAHKIAPAKVA
ncbi:MAG: antibiotic biosynthesis monooxygenase [Acidobacteriota bacterium]|nr:antibiotic biosynthesis monooxygenase [Acidobacteriota bacterium]